MRWTMEDLCPVSDCVSDYATESNDVVRASCGTRTRWGRRFQLHGKTREQFPQPKLTRLRHRLIVLCYYCFFGVLTRESVASVVRRCLLVEIRQQLTLSKAVTDSSLSYLLNFFICIEFQPKQVFYNNLQLHRQANNRINLPVSWSRDHGQSHNPTCAYLSSCQDLRLYIFIKTLGCVEEHAQSDSLLTSNDEQNPGHECQDLLPPVIVGHESDNLTGEQDEEADQRK